jgi:hypothetical protein
MFFNATRKTMKAHTNAARIMGWIKQNGLDTATAAQVGASRLMTARDAAYALEYGARHGALERVKRADCAQNERVAFRPTGKALPKLRVHSEAPSFDALLSAWGIPTVPPRLTGFPSRTYELAYDGEE